MDTPQLPQDDLLDTMEMANKIEESIYDILDGCNQNLAMSAIMSATANTMLSQCESVKEVILFRNIFMSVLDDAILNIKF